MIYTRRRMAHEHDHADDEQDEHDEDVEPSDEAARAEAEAQVRRRLALAQIRQYGDPVLRMRAQEVTEFDDELARVSERMIALMHDAAGVGLAATQIGVLRRVFVFHEEGEDRVVVNPALTRSSKAVEVDEGGVPLARARPCGRRASGRGHARRERRHRSTGLVRPRGTGGTGRSARARPSRRQADHRPHGSGVATRGAAPAPAEASAREVENVARIAVAATAPFGADVLERLAAHHDVRCLLTRPDAPRGRGRRLAPPPAKLVAENLGLPVVQPERLEAGLELDAPTVVVVAYGLIVPEGLLAERQVAERPPVAPPALAWRRPGRACHPRR